MKVKRLLSWLIAAAMLVTLLPIGVLPAMAEGVDMSKLTTYGRTYVKDGNLYLFWTNSGFAFRFNGTGAAANIASDNIGEIYKGYIQVYVDGEFTPSRTIRFDALENPSVVLAEGLPAGEHTIEVRKRNEGGYDGTARLALQGLTITGGEFLDPPAAPARRIEFIGDSITSGFTNMVIDGNGGYSTANENGTMTYAVLAAKELGADAQVLSRSGIHYCHSDPHRDNFYEHYTATATLPGKTDGNFACADEWDFAAHPSDVVVINLGTNDGGAGRTAAQYQSDAEDFLRLVREKNPAAVIIWAYGFMGANNNVKTGLEAAVKALNDAGDDKVFYYPLAASNQATEGIGDGGHPSIQAHINRSLALAQFIAEKTGWEADGTPFLKAQLEFSKEYHATEEKLAGYTVLSKKTFTDAIAAGEALLAAGNATADQLIAAADAIWQAQAGLMSTADVSGEYIKVEAYDSTSGIQSNAAALDTEDYKEGDGAVSTSGSSGLVFINKSNFNVQMPSDMENWYLEFWLYVDHPENLPGESCIEISKTVDQIEQQWLLGTLGLQSGWNKVQLKLNKNASFDVLKNVRCFFVNVTKPITVKLDNMVIARGKAAADITEWEAAIAEAEAKLAEKDSPELQTALEVARTAVTQADVDAFTARLKKAITAARSQNFLDNITTYGRTFVKNNFLYLFWTNSGVSFTINGTGATADIVVENSSANLAAYLNVYVDGAFDPTATLTFSQVTNNGTVLIKDLPAGTHTVELRKRNEAAYGGSSSIAIRAIHVTDGEFLEPPAPPARTIEFIGDSITSGFGDLMTTSDYSSISCDGTLTYAVLAAKELGADAQVLSRSGIHYCHTGKTVDSFYDHYTTTATLPNKTTGAWTDNTSWDFTSHPSDVVVINLGTNDVGAGRTAAEYTSNAVDFLRLVREKNPDAVIIWTYGMMGSSIRSSLEAAVKTLNDEGDSKVYYLPLANYVTSTEGVSLGHPTVQTHINRSIVLANFIAEKTGWEVDPGPMLKAQVSWSTFRVPEDTLGDYVSATADAYAAALADAQAVMAKSDASDEEILAAADAVWKAQIGLAIKGEVSGEYITVEPYEGIRGISFSGGTGTLDTQDYREGTGCVSVSGSSGTISINRTNAYNVAMPADMDKWYLEFWLYVDHPENIPGGSCIEISKTVDQIEQQWGLDGLGLRPGWNKVQLPLNSNASFDTLKNIRCFIVNLSAPLTLKLDNLVLAHGRFAENTAEWEAAMEEAQAWLQQQENDDLAFALGLARTAVTQADVDAFTARLKAALEAAPDVLKGDADGDGEITSTDARLALQLAVNKILAEDIANADALDVDGDGDITSTDARLILQKAVNKISDWP